MQYDPIKRSLGNVFNKTPFLRKLFYQLLDLLLLRAWHVKREFRDWASDKSGTMEILDAGSGFGQYTYYMSLFLRNSRILAVDVKKEQVADCNRFFSRIGRNNVRFEVADLEQFAMAGAFDFILTVDVMEHILNDVKVFRNFHKSLKEGGLLLISTPSDQGGSDVHDHGEGSFIEEHVRDGYNISEICDKLRQAGFSRTEARYVYGKPGQLSWKLSMKIPILMVGFSKLLFILLPFYYLLTFWFCLILNFLDVTLSHKSGTGLLVKAWK